MTDTERGPFWDREAFPVAARVVQPGYFESLLEPLANVLGASDHVLATHHSAIGSVTADGLEESFALSIGVAETVLADQIRGANDQTAIELVDAGAGAESYRQQSIRFLPGPETTPRVELVEPPAPPPGAAEPAPPGPPEKD